jgi:hypothetical protein
MPALHLLILVLGSSLLLLLRAAVAADAAALPENIISSVDVTVDGVSSESVHVTSHAASATATATALHRHEMKYAISLTTIPSRIPHLHHVVESWLAQEEVQPAYILVFVPRHYKRFKKKSTRRSARKHSANSSGEDEESPVPFISPTSPGDGMPHQETFKRMAEGLLADHFHSRGDSSRRRQVVLYRDSDNHSDNHSYGHGNGGEAVSATVVRVVETEDGEDWGPATKYVGFLQHRLQWESLWPIREGGEEHTNTHIHRPPDYWVVCDDDVRYSPGTLRLYDAFLSGSDQSVARLLAEQGEQYVILLFFLLFLLLVMLSYRSIAVCLPACLHSLTPHGTSLTIISLPQSLIDTILPH